LASSFGTRSLLLEFLSSSLELRDFLGSALFCYIGER